MAVTMLDHALSYVKKFKAIIPTGTWEFTSQAGNKINMWKRPLVKNWTSEPLQTPAQVRSQWNKYASHGHVPGIGLVTGQICGGYIAIDFDRDHGGSGIDGYDNMLSWQRDTGRTLPETWTVNTGSGGVHFYYHTHRAMRSWSNPQSGIDLRADGGMIVLPPSPHPSGRFYEWEAGYSPKEFGEAAEADENVFAFLDYFRPTDAEFRATIRRGEGGERKMLLPPEILQGGRTSALISLIGTLNRLGVCDVAIEAVVRMENEKCVPPFTEEELQQTIFPAIYRFEKGIAEADWKDKETWKKEKSKELRKFRAQVEFRQYQI